MGTPLKKRFSILAIPLIAMVGCGGNSANQCYYDTGATGAVRSARVFYPCDLPDNAFRYHATTLSGGMINIKENMYWLAKRLVNRNDMVVFTITARDNRSVKGYEDAHKSGYDLMQSANHDPENPLYLRLDRYALMGYSMGGGGVLNAANDLEDAVDAIIAMAPYSPQSNLNSTTADALLIVGRNDTIAPPSFADTAYDNLPDTIAKADVRLANFGHLQWVNNAGNSNNAKAAISMISNWLDYALTGDEHARQSLMDPPAEVVRNEHNL